MLVARRRRGAPDATGSTPSSSSTPTREPEHGEPRPDPPRHARGAGPADLARGALLAGPPRAADRARRRRPARGAPDRAAGHAGRRAACSTRGRAGTARVATLLVRLERLARGEAPEPTGRALDPAHPPPPPHGRRAKRGPKQPLSSSALALEQRLRDAGVEPPIDSELDAGDLAALRDAGTRGARVEGAPLPRGCARGHPRAPRRARPAQRWRGHARAATRRARAPRASSRRRCSSTSTRRR